MKKNPVSISDGKLKSYEDPLRRLVPIDKERGDRVEPEKDTGENEILKREKQEKKFSKDDMIYSERRAFRIKSVFNFHRVGSGGISCLFSFSRVCSFGQLFFS